MSDQKYPQNDEVDLMQIFQYIKDGIVNLVKSIFNLLLLILIVLRSELIKHYKTIFLSALIGGVSGYAYYALTDPFFVTSTVVQSPFLRGYIFKNEIDKLTIYCEEEDTTALSRSLKLPTDVVRGIKDIEVKSIIDNRYISANEDSLLSVSNVNGSNFLITVSLYQEGSDIQKIQSGLKYYFETNNNLNAQYEISRGALLKEKDNLLNEIAKLDTLKSLINKQIGSPSESISRDLNISLKKNENLVNDPLKIYDQTLKLSKDIIEIERRLIKDKKIIFLNEFSGFQKHGGLSFAMSVVWGAGIGVGAVIILLIIIALNNYLAQQEKKLSDAKS